MDTYLKQGQRLSEETVAIESLASTLRQHSDVLDAKAYTLLNIATEGYCERWGIPRVTIATESFQNTARAQASIVATEGIIELAKAGWKRFIEWLKGLIDKIKALFKRGEARGKTLSQQALELEKMLAKS